MLIQVFFLNSSYHTIDTASIYTASASFWVRFPLRMHGIIQQTCFIHGSLEKARCLHHFNIKSKLFEIINNFFLWNFVMCFYFSLIFFFFFHIEWMRHNEIPMATTKKVIVETKSRQNYCGNIVTNETLNWITIGKRQFYQTQNVIGCIEPRLSSRITHKKQYADCLCLLWQVIDRMFPLEVHHMLNKWFISTRFCFVSAVY